MAANDGGASVPIQIESVPELTADAAASRLPGAVAAAGIVPGAVATIFSADDGESSVHNDPAILRSGDSGQTYRGTSAPMPEMNFSESFDTGCAVGDGE